MSNGHWARNGAPREGGRFLWRQIYNARKWGARMMYGAMWDEYDEGTQFLPAVTKTEDLPHDENHKFTLIAYDVDGYDVPADWYMRIAGYGSELVKGERQPEDRFPEKELRDWEYSHPKTEIRPSLESMLASGSGRNVGGGGGSSSTDGARQSYENWLKIEGQGKDKEDAPPPPYSLEVEESTGVQSVTAQGPQTPISTRPEPPQTDSRPPPPVPPRQDPQFGFSVPSQHSVGAPPVPISSRPTSILASPDSSRPPSHGPHQVACHSPATSPSPTATQTVLVQSSYAGQSVSAPPPTSQFSHNTVDVDLYTRPTVHLPTPDLSPLPQPASTRPSQPSTQPAWPPQDWSYPSQPFSPPQFPVPPIQASYGYPSGYGESIAFPEAMRPVGPTDYGFVMPQTTSILGPQQLHPGPPPSLQPRESHHRASPGNFYVSILNNRLGVDLRVRPAQHLNRTHPAAAAPPQQHYLRSSLPSPGRFSPSADARSPERLAFPTPSTGFGVIVRKYW